MAHDVEGMRAWSALQAPANKAFPQTGWNCQGKVFRERVVRPSLDGSLSVVKDMQWPGSRAASGEVVERTSWRGLHRLECLQRPAQHLAMSILVPLGSCVKSADVLSVVEDVLQSC